MFRMAQFFPPNSRFSAVRIFPLLPEMVVRQAGQHAAAAELLIQLGTPFVLKGPGDFVEAISRHNPAGPVVNDRDDAVILLPSQVDSCEIAVPFLRLGQLFTAELLLPTG
jgi:hypothetical protein